MESSLVFRAKILAARLFALTTGRLPAAANWPTTWNGSRRYAPGRWAERDKGFARRDFDYEDAVAFLIATRRGTPKDIRAGSIPEPDLAFIASQLATLPTESPLRGLHIGNYIGLSLASLTDTLRRLHADSVMLSVDPNIPHRGIDVPQDLVTGLMTRYGLEHNWLPVTGYSLDRSGVFGVLNRKGGTTGFSSYHGFAADNVLKNLLRLNLRFDFALIDGNHNAPYLRREIEVLAKLVRPGGLLILDDVSENWEGVTAVFEGLDKARFRRVAHENRIGVVRRLRQPGDGGGKRRNTPAQERAGAGQ